MLTNTVEVTGWIELVDVPGATPDDPAEHERTRKSRLADVLIVLERDAAVIERAITTRLAETTAFAANPPTPTLVIDDRDPVFTVRFAAEPDMVAALADGASDLGEAVEIEIHDAIARKAAAVRRFSPVVRLDHATPHPDAGPQQSSPRPMSPPPATPAPASNPAPARPSPHAKRSPAASLPRRPQGWASFWLIVLFALIAAVLFTAAFLMLSLQPIE